ncbi:MAG: hypothetical protein NC300_12565, partial [Bacteroidales bacterium]|nr:hypothetical protein [Clostridium sp.]MCM1204967.1 hypothetical protein [Bacteroidales bacterium]
KDKCITTHFYWLYTYYTRVYMDGQTMTTEDWKSYLGISEEPEEVTPEDDVEGEWEYVRKL